VSQAPAAVAGQTRCAPVRRARPATRLLNVLVTRCEPSDPVRGRSDTGVLHPSSHRQRQSGQTGRVDGDDRGADRQERWIAAKAREFEALRGSCIVFWVGVEMALRGGDEEPAQFSDPAVPFQQFSVLELALADGTIRKVTTYQNDTVFGLELQEASVKDDLRLEQWDGIYRLREPSEWPTGFIDRARADIDDGDVLEVLLSIDGQPLLLLAGEVQEERDGRLSYIRGDESILVFTDPMAANEIAWVPKRP
jgi:hypothetical protein